MKNMLDRIDVVSATTKPLLLVLDFDGTVCIGDGPVWSYAESTLGEALSSDAISEAEAADIRAHLASFLDGEVRRDWLDGYAAVSELLGGYVTEEVKQRAYRASRDALAEGRVVVRAPDGLAALLERIGDWVERVVVTNAPETGVAEVLRRVGLAPYIDRIVADAHKPSGWASLLPGLTGSRTTERCMTVGDIWENDLAAPHELGYRTALIDRFRQEKGSPDSTATEPTGLLDDIEFWATRYQPSADRQSIAQSSAGQSPAQEGSPGEGAGAEAVDE